MKGVKKMLAVALLSVTALLATAQEQLVVKLNDGTKVAYNIDYVKQMMYEDKSHVEKSYVDLGLSVKWATCNVGASSPEDFGDYFAWGETTGYNSGKANFEWSTYTLCGGSDKTMTKYCTSSSYGTVDNKRTLELSDDAAYANWGGSWRMPTDGEMGELINKCTWIWTTQNGVNGYKVTGTNGNSIFLPAAGYIADTRLIFAGRFGEYHSSSLHKSYSYCARCMDFSNSKVYVSDIYPRYYGRSVRPVCP